MKRLFGSGSHRQAKEQDLLEPQQQQKYKWLEKVRKPGLLNTVQFDKERNLDFYQYKLAHCMMPHTVNGYNFNEANSKENK